MTRVWAKNTIVDGIVHDAKTNTNEKEIGKMKKIIGIALVTTALIACIAAPVAATATYSGTSTWTQLHRNNYGGYTNYRYAAAYNCNTKGAVQGAVTVSLRNNMGYNMGSKTTNLSRGQNTTCTSYAVQVDSRPAWDYRYANVRTH